jgi:hypothetical protein
MSALPAQVHQQINLDPRNRRCFREDIEIRFGKRVGHFSVEVDHRLDVDGNVVISRIYYDGQPITAIPVLVEMLEQSLEDERS